MQTYDSAPRHFICSLAFLAARKMAAHYNRQLSRMGLTIHQVMALGVLWREDGISLGVFADRLGVGKAAAVTMVKRLESMGLVIRSSHPTDARLNRLTLSDKARAAAPRLLEMGRELEQSLERAMGTTTMNALVKGLTTICELDIGKTPAHDTEDRKDPPE